jgi:hypothetical protein
MYRVKVQVAALFLVGFFRGGGHESIRLIHQGFVLRHGFTPVISAIVYDIAAIVLRAKK